MTARRGRELRLAHAQALEVRDGAHGAVERIGAEQRVAQEADRHVVHDEQDAARVAAGEQARAAVGIARERAEPALAARARPRSGPCSARQSR